jgi:HK97 family phage major capsid protein
MDKLEVRNEIKAKNTQIAEFADKLILEKREATNVEKLNIDAIKAEIVELQKQLTEVEKVDVRKATNMSVGESHERFSLIKSIRDIVDGKPNSDITMTVTNEGRESFTHAGLSYRGQLPLPMESRALDSILAGTATQGQEIVAEQKFALLPYLRANLVLAAAGAQILTGLVGDVSIPVLSTGATAAWKSEVATATVAGQGFSEVTLSPKRITSFYDISKQFIQQDSVQAEAMLRTDLMNSVMDLLESTILGVAAGSSTQPVGLFYSPTYAFTSGSTFVNMVAMETAVANNNALKNGAVYLLHPTSVGVLKTTPKTPTYGGVYIAENSLINGYNYFTTTNLPSVLTGCKAAIFGNFNDLIIGQWSGLDITVDPYSRAVFGEIRIVVNYYVDAKVRRTASFSKAAIK